MPILQMLGWKNAALHPPAESGAYVYRFKQLSMSERGRYRAPPTDGFPAECDNSLEWGAFLYKAAEEKEEWHVHVMDTTMYKIDKPYRIQEKANVRSWREKQLAWEKEKLAAQRNKK